MLCVCDFSLCYVFVMYLCDFSLCYMFVILVYAMCSVILVYVMCL